MKPDHQAALAPAVKVWDPFVRLFHWSLVTCIVLNQFVLEAGEWPHEIAGYTASGLVAARVLWGFVGSRHARFAGGTRRHTGSRGRPEEAGSARRGD